MKIRFFDYTTIPRSEWYSAKKRTDVFEFPISAKLSDVIEHFKKWAEDFRYDRWSANLDGCLIGPEKYNNTLLDFYGKDPGDITAQFSIDGYINDPDPAEVLSGYTVDDWKHEIANIVRLAIDKDYGPDGLYEGDNYEAFKKAFKETFSEEFHK